jgi:hypothetical protein
MVQPGGLHLSHRAPGAQRPQLRPVRRPLEQRVATLEGRIDTRINALEAKLDTRINTLEAKLDAKLDKTRAELEATLERRLGEQAKWFLNAWVVLLGAILTVLASNIALWFRG